MRYKNIITYFRFYLLKYRIDASLIFKNQRESVFLIFLMGIERNVSFKSINQRH